MTIAYGTRHPCDEAQARGSNQQTLPCPERDKPWVLVTAILGSSLAFIEGSVVNLALPAIQADMGATSTALQWVVNSYLLMLGSFMLIGGSLGDRFGLRRIFIIGTSLFGFSALACTFAPSLLLLSLGRLVQGVGGALLVPNSLALISSHFDAEERGRAIGTWAGASALTTAFGPVIGGFLVDLGGWPAVFLLVAPLAAITVAIAWWRVPASPVRTDERLDYFGALFLVASLCLLIFALVNPASQSQRWLFIALSVLMGAAFFFREKHFESPMLPLSLFRSRLFSGANLMTLLLYCALSGALYFLPFNLIQVQGYSAMQAGAAFLPFTLIIGFGSTFAGDLIRKFNPRVILTIGPAVAAAGYFLLIIPGNNATFLTDFLPGIVIIGVGMMLSVAPLTTVVMGSASNRMAGVASGVNNTAARLAGVLAVAVLTAVAVSRFTPALVHHLQRADVPPEIVSQLEPRASELAELTPSADVSEPVAAVIADAVELAYVETFRLLVAICGGLAIGSALIAWTFLAEDNGSA